MRPVPPHLVLRADVKSYDKSRSEYPSFNYFATCPLTNPSQDRWIANHFNLMTQFDLPQITHIFRRGPSVVRATRGLIINPINSGMVRFKTMSSLCKTSFHEFLGILPFPQLYTFAQAKCPFSNQHPNPATPLGRYRVLSPNSSVRVSPLVLGGANIGDKWDKLLERWTRKCLSSCSTRSLMRAGTSSTLLTISARHSYVFLLPDAERSDSQDGSSEEFIGEWAEKRGIRDQLVIATKVRPIPLSGLGAISRTYFSLVHNVLQRCGLLHCRQGQLRREQPQVPPRKRRRFAQEAPHLVHRHPLYSLVGLPTPPSKRL